MQQVILPEVIAELNDALILVVSGIGEHLVPLFDKIYRGEQIEYRFQWDLIRTEDYKYIVGLVVCWGSSEESVTIGFTPELWEFLGVVRNSGQLMVMTDLTTKMAEMPIEGEIQDPLLVPGALIINEAYWGMETLSRQVVEEVLLNEPKEELYKLLDILRPNQAPGFLN